MTCGSVDDGKSTLIGRLLFDTKAILADTLTAIEKTSSKRGLDRRRPVAAHRRPAGRARTGITIDVAYRYFSTGTRKYIIADARAMSNTPQHGDRRLHRQPGHHPDRRAQGVLTQTRRHSYLATLVGIPPCRRGEQDGPGGLRPGHLRPRSSAEYKAFADQIGLTDVRFIPLSALNGDMIVDRGERLNWYDGPDADRHPRKLRARRPHREGRSFRFPVQYVVPPQASDNPRTARLPRLHGPRLLRRDQVGDSVTGAAQRPQTDGQGHPAVSPVPRPKPIHEQS